MSSPQPSDLDHTHPAIWDEEKLLAKCRLTFSRASGPGGQNRNKVETSVQIEYLPDNIIASASERRSQNENRKVALQRLRCKLAVEVPWVPIASSHTQVANVLSEELEPTWHVSETWLRYCRSGRMDVSDTNPDWPAVLAELIGMLTRFEWNVASAATCVGTSTSQLVKLLKKHPPAFALLNQARTKRGQRPFE